MQETAHPFRTEGGFGQRQRALEQKFRVAVSALNADNVRQVRQRSNAQPLQFNAVPGQSFGNFDRTTESSLGFRVPTQVLLNRAIGIQDIGQVSAVLPGSPLEETEGTRATLPSVFELS